ncbi:MAG: antitoxin Xre/MbcA/ParS toxin-binding domain-containing protein [Sphingomicrobium sp.]
MGLAAEKRQETPGDIGRVVALLGGPAVLKVRINNRLDAHNVIEKGFPSAVLSKLVSNVALIKDDEALQKALGISKRTLYRRQGGDAAKNLSKEQSGRTWRFAEILAKAIGIFGSKEEAEHWMEEPAIGLNRERPIDLLSTTAGTELVDTYLDQIEYGVYV